WHLPDARAAPRGPEGHLDLEDVAAGVDPVERNLGEGLRPPRLEAAGEVVRTQPEDDPGEEAPAAGDDPPREAPVDHPAAVGVAGADHEVGLVAIDRSDD